MLRVRYYLLVLKEISQLDSHEPHSNFESIAIAIQLLSKLPLYMLIRDLIYL